MSRRNPILIVCASIVAFIILYISHFTTYKESESRLTAYEHVLHTFTEDSEHSSRMSGKDDKILRAAPQKRLGVDPAIKLTEAETDNLLDVQNATLGFQKIYVLSMPSRTDKRDAVALAAYLTGLDIEFVDGIDGTLVSEKAYPQKWPVETEPIGSLGCWRGHMDIYQKMMREGIQTALIMEDDVDWDVMIKAQMTEVARGTRYLQNATSQMQHSPYGDEWDLLTTGHCGVWNRHMADGKYWIIDDDPTVLPAEIRTWARRPNLTPEGLSGNRTRLVFQAYRLSCTASYALSIRGAARLTYDQAVLPHAEAIDTAMSNFCKYSVFGENSCLGTYPMITGVHRPAGARNKDSDRVGNSDAIRKTARSKHLMYSTRLNLEALLKGQTTVKAQFPKEAAMAEIDASKLELPVGRGAFFGKDEFVQNDSETSKSDSVTA